MVYKIFRQHRRSAWFGPAVLALSFLCLPAAQADDGVTYGPSPGFAGSTEQFDACGFQQGETADLTMDGTALAQATASGGCVHIAQQTALDIAPTTHIVSIKGETSNTEKVGAYVVVPPTITAPPAPVLPGGTTIVIGQFFAPGRTPMLLDGSGSIPPAPGMTDPNGGLLAQVTVLPNTPPGTYPLLIQDNPWLTNPPPLFITVLPPPSDAPASAQPASGNWSLTATSTLKRDDGKLVANGSSTLVAQFGVSSGQVKGQGQLNVSLDMTVGDASCHGDGSPTPFTVAGSQSGGLLHLVLTGANSSMIVTITCNNGITLPFPLPAGSSSEPFDIEATDGKAMDMDGSNQFVVVPQGFTGHTHVVLAQG